jgi:hypothetical protein
MSAKRGLTWLFARNTEWGRKQHGEETLLEQGVRERKPGRIVRVAYQKSLEQQGRDIQYVDEECRVEVKIGLHRRTDSYTTLLGTALRLLVHRQGEVLAVWCRPHGLEGAHPQ